MYQVPLGDFTSTREALAARLKADGDAKAAAEVKAARKPSVSAWAANQVVWRSTREWERLRSAAEAMREKHQKGAPAEELRRASGEQREALQACEARAMELLVKHGHAASPAVLQKVQHTLLALAYGVSGVTPGRLDQDLPPPGFEALSGMSMAPPRKPAASGAPKPREAETKEERARRRAALAAAEARLAEAKRAVQKASQRLSAAEERLARLEKQLDEARAARTDARREIDAAEKEQAAAEASRKALPAEKADD